MIIELIVLVLNGMNVTQWDIGLQQYNAGVGASGGGCGSGGSSEESSRLGASRSSGGESSASADPSSSEQSCDTVIYVGPIHDDATDGEHPPVYLPSLNSGDNRCSMTKALRGSSVDKTASPHSKNGASTSSKQATPVKAEALPAGSPVKTSKNGEEQWIDGPRFHKSRMSHARHLVRGQRETWVDGPTPSTPATPDHSDALAYGFMDQHKQGMIRQWVETQSAQVSASTAHLK